MHNNFVMNPDKKNIKIALTNLNVHINCVVHSVRGYDHICPKSNQAQRKKNIFQYQFFM